MKLWRYLLRNLLQPIHEADDCEFCRRLRLARGRGVTA